MKSLVLGATAVLALTAGLAAQQTGTTLPGGAKPAAPQAVPAPQAPIDPKSPAGLWMCKLNIPGQEAAPAQPLEIKLDATGAKATGTLTMPNMDAPLAGDFTDGKLKFTVTMDMGADKGGTVKLDFEGKMGSDGKLSGTFTTVGLPAPLTWKAERAKAK